MEDNENRKSFNNLSAREVEENLYKDLEEAQRKRKKIRIIVIILLVFIFRGSIMYWLKFSWAVPSDYVLEEIDTSKEPVQINYKPSESKEKTFIYKSLINKNKVEIIPQAHYILSGKVIASNHDFIFISKFFDSAALYDLGAAWGKMADKKLYKKKYIKVESHKTELTGARRLSWHYNSKIPYSGGYIHSHLSHTHIIPANRNVMAAMLKLKLYQDFKLEGELVDMVYKDKNNRIAKSYTSLSRTDSDSSSRGSGACECMYVTKVQIGKTEYK